VLNVIWREQLALIGVRHKYEVFPVGPVDLYEGTFAVVTPFDLAAVGLGYA